MPKLAWINLRMLSSNPFAKLTKAALVGSLNPSSYCLPNLRPSIVVIFPVEQTNPLGTKPIGQRQELATQVGWLVFEGAVLSNEHLFCALHAVTDGSATASGVVLAGVVGAAVDVTGGAVDGTAVDGPGVTVVGATVAYTIACSWTCATCVLSIASTVSFEV